MHVITTELCCEITRNTEMNNGQSTFSVSHDYNAKASFTQKLPEVLCFQCDNLHKRNEVSCNRVSVRYKERNKEGRYVLFEDKKLSNMKCQKIQPMLLQNCYSYNSTKWQLCVETVEREYVFNSSLDQELTYHSGKAFFV